VATTLRTRSREAVRGVVRFLRGQTTPPPTSIHHCQFIEVCADSIITVQRVRRLCRDFKSVPTDIHVDGRSYRLCGQQERRNGFWQNSESRYQIFPLYWSCTVGVYNTSLLLAITRSLLRRGFKKSCEHSINVSLCSAISL